MGELLDTLEQREDLWGAAWQSVHHGMARVDSGDVKIECVGSIGVAVSLLAALPCLPTPAALRRISQPPGSYGPDDIGVWCERRYILTRCALRDRRYTHMARRLCQGW